MSVSRCCGAKVIHYRDEYFFEVSCSECGKELSDYDVLEE